ncbi:Hypothetical_protein [Hexamita inflata]|uniref:Hypothetical_protein n=1 Tax=Hexamita inflata TaxID=28002 RepID=A0AA86NPD2_9EUKA|nr:Hypothetical protein HINF_LOCUS11652 [Hexamita inflata]
MRGKRECSDVLKAIVAICGFPVVLVLYLLYYVFVVPIQQIVKIVSINKIHESQAYYTEDPSVFEQKALTYAMFTHKPVHYLGFFISVENSTLYLHDADLKIIKEYKIQYNFLQKSEKYLCVNVFFKYLFVRKYRGVFITLPPPYYTNGLFFKGKFYFTAFQYLYVIQDTKVERILVPNYFHSIGVRLNYPPGQLFTLNGKLFIHNQSKQLFEVRRNKLKCVDQEHVNKYYYQFADRVYCVDATHISRYEIDTMKWINISEIQNIRIHFCNGGALIYQSEQEVFALNMLDGEVQQVKQPKFVENITDNIEFGLYGCQLKKEIMQQLFGVDITHRMMQYYYRYKQGQTQIFKQILEYVKTEHKIPKIQLKLMYAQYENRGKIQKVSKQMQTLVQANTKLTQLMSFFSADLTQ